MARSPLRRIYWEQHVVIGVVFGALAYFVTLWAGQPPATARTMSGLVGLPAMILGPYVFEAVALLLVALDLRDGRSGIGTIDLIESWDEIFPRH